MNPFQHTYLLVSLLGLSQALFLCLFFAINPRGRGVAGRLLVAILVALSSVFITNVLLAQGRLEPVPLFLLIFCQYCMAPLIYLFVRTYTGKTPFSRRDWLHLALIVPLCLPWPGLIPFLLWNLHALAYQFGILRNILAWRTGKSSRGERIWAISVALGYTLTWMTINLMALLSPLLDDAKGLFWKAFTVIAAVHIYAIAYLALKFPMVRHRIAGRLRRRREGGDSDEVSLGRLRQGMLTQGWFRDPALSVATLAGKLGLPAHELSRLINEGLELNFNQLVNGFRLTAIKQALADPVQDRYTIEALASEAGFRSASSFYRIFKHETGETPSQYRINSRTVEVAKDGQITVPMLERDPQTS